MTLFYSDMNTQELLKVVDRSDPQVKALAKRLEEFIAAHNELAKMTQTQLADATVKLNQISSNYQPVVIDLG